MTSMKMWYLFLLAAVLSIVPTVAEVVKKVSDCDQFLLKKNPPDVTGILEDKKMDKNRYKFICQTYDNKRRFLTLYDTKNKIPVYSAYKYTGETEKGRPCLKWKIEPQFRLSFLLDRDLSLLNFLYTQCLTMTSMKMWYLFLLAAVLSIVPTVAEVVKKVSDCDQFLLKKNPPDVTGILEDKKMKYQYRYKFICQTYDNKRRFLTLYDTRNKIPVYSAYKYTGETEKGTFKTPHWKIEPQLENKDENKNMCDVDKNKTYTNQAGDNDYTNKTAYNRGPLIPNSYGSQISDKNSTFTLTNIVPQEESFNRGSWSRMEKCIKCVMDEYCKDKNGSIKAYVVTGAIPNYNNNNKPNNRVNIPSKLWSAFCCKSPKEKKWIASAHWGKNVPDEPKGKYLPTITLEKLREELTVIAFPETKCPLQTTVSEFYKNQDPDCECQKT
ncbi:uncharacterized protein LOC123980349 [Micropterus dolomieu]|uniref:uncharacterized protein LOC123980349 n=1 Tax=Micropterus dolomieu TaxID=147949 RepID=UPI001E8E94DE|nr:uncharacterized protein LOC123980349 [Micropterus dolomieu]XP_045920649.1 uncharacterized protein LOC123980349 [Micropterus dolomieu]